MCLRREQPDVLFNVLQMLSHSLGRNAGWRVDRKHHVLSPRLNLCALIWPVDDIRNDSIPIRHQHISGLELLSLTPKQ